MTEETKETSVETDATDAKTTELTAKEAAAKVEVEQATEAAKAVTVDNAVMAALRKRDIETAQRLLAEDAAENAKPDLSKYVEVGTFDALKASLDTLSGELEATKHQNAVDHIVTNYKLSESEKGLIETDNLELFEARAKLLFEQNKQAVRQSVTSTVVPEDLKESPLAQRLLRGGF